MEINTDEITMQKLAAEHSLEEFLHSINNTLNSVSMQSELAQLYLEQGNVEASLEAMKTIHKECKRLGKITHSFQQ